MFIVGMPCHEMEWERTLSRLYVCHLLISILHRYHVQVEILQHGQSGKKIRPGTASICWASVRNTAVVYSLTSCLIV